jgi:ABC-type uncharacterized transport system permease subunit
VFGFARNETDAYFIKIFVVEAYVKVFVAIELLERK